MVYVPGFAFFANPRPSRIAQPDGGRSSVPRSGIRVCWPTVPSTQLCARRFLPWSSPFCAGPDARTTLRDGYASSSSPPHQVAAEQRVGRDALAFPAQREKVRRRGVRHQLLRRHPHSSGSRRGDNARVRQLLRQMHHDLDARIGRSAREARVSSSSRPSATRHRTPAATGPGLAASPAHDDRPRRSARERTAGIHAHRPYVGNRHEVECHRGGVTSKTSHWLFWRSGRWPAST